MLKDPSDFRLLVVDDEQEIFERIKYRYISEQFFVFIIGYIEDGQIFFYDAKPQVVIISTDLPGGRWFLQEIKHAKPETISIVFTEVTDPDYIGFCKSLGADYCFVKPLSEDDYKELDTIIFKEVQKYANKQEGIKQ